MKTFRRGQGGWVGLIAMLLALAIVAYLSKDVFHKYGLIPSMGETTVIRGGASGERGGTAGERARAPAAIDMTGTGIETTTPAPTNVLERARGLEDSLRQQADKRGGN